MCTLRPPRADMATMNGIIHDITPNTLSPKVCKIFNILTLCTGIGSFQTFILSVMEWQSICHTRLELIFKTLFQLDCLKCNMFECYKSFAEWRKAQNLPQLWR